MASITKSGSGYRAFLCVNGKRETKVFRTKSEAKLWSETRTYFLKTNDAIPEAEKTTVEDLFHRYMDKITPQKRGADKEKIRINALLNHPSFPSKTKLTAFTPELIASWRDYRLRQVTAGTVLRELGVISTIMEYAVKEWGLLKQNPVKQIRKPNAPAHRDVLYSLSQIRAILKAMGHSPRGEVRSVAQSVAICFLLALRTGMRAGELTGLTWDRVHPGYCVLPVTKTVPRQVPLTKRSGILLDRMRGYDPKFVFGLSPQTLDANFRKYRDRAGISGVTFHDARKFAATSMARKIPILDLCRVFGWSSPKFAMVYYAQTAADIANLLDSHH